MEWEGDGVMYRATVMGFNSTTRRHNLLYDDGDREKINLEEVAHRWLDARGMPEGTSQHHSQDHLGEEEPGHGLGQGQRGGSGQGQVHSHHQAGGKGGNLKGKGMGGGYAAGGEMDSMASLLQAVQAVQGPGHDLSIAYEPQQGWGQHQVLNAKSPGRKGHSRQHPQFNTLLVHPPQLPAEQGHTQGLGVARVKLDEALGFRLAPCPVPLFRTFPPPPSAQGRVSCSSPKPFLSNPSPTPASTGASSAAALHRLQHHSQEVGSLLFEQGSQLSQLIHEASKNKGHQQPHVNGMLGKVLNSQLLAAMPASAMNTVQLYRAYKFG